MKFELNDEKIKGIISQTKNLSVNVEETIENTIHSSFINDDAYVEIQYCGASYPVCKYMTEEGLDYEFLSDEYFQYINKCIETEEPGDIYIALAYANPIIAGYGNDLEYNIENVDENLIQRTWILTWKEKKDLVFDGSDRIIHGGTKEDYGILIKKIDGKNVAIFGNRDVHGCYGPYAPLYFKSIEDQLEQPLYQILIEMMFNAIIFEEE